MVVATVRKVKIVTSYANWSPRFQVIPTVKSLLRATPKRYLVGLDAVVLTNVGALNHDRRRGSVSSSGRKAQIGNVLGLYHPRWQGTKAWIELFVDNISKQWPDGKPVSYMRIDLTFAEVLYHEVGHHIHAQHLPEYRPKENVADGWSERMTKRYMWRHHWETVLFLGPFILARLAIRFLRQRIMAASRADSSR
jgi:hypothetical protein